MASQKKILTYKVSVEDSGLRLDQFLTLKNSNLSRSRIKALIKESFIVKINNKKRTVINEPSKKVKLYENFEITIPEAVDPKPIGQNIPLDILHEDNDIIVINKPANIVVHPAPGNYDNTLVNALIAHCGSSLSGIGGEKKPGIVHRLDKDTSGVMVVAKNDKSHESLSKQFSNHGRDGKLVRSYKALVWGIPHLQSGKIETYLGRSLKNRKKIAIFSEEKKGRKFAITHWKKIKSNKKLDISEIECNLETGRTHQIRVHLTHIGIPIIGDQVYGTGFKSKLNKYDSSTKTLLSNIFYRQALHAYKLGFEHPKTKKKLNFETKLPKDIKKISDLI
ncbi:MAG: RluA family pseudouridine synthase [Pseudomonadota bacterium]|nr:RluA family pseudouridine synthase [Pseudomonadota bacterium]